MTYPAPDGTLDGRLREGNTYLEHSALGVSLNSGLMEGMSRLELIEQSVPITRSVARPGGGSMKEFTNWDAVSYQVLDVNLDGRPMEGTTYLEHSAPGVSLDSGLMEGMSSPELLEQSVLGALSVVRREETDAPALSSQVNHGQSHLKSSARPMSDPDQVNNADVNADVDTDLPEISAPMMRFLKLEAQSCPPGQDVLGCRPMEGIIEPLQVELSGLALAPDSKHEEHLPNSKPWDQSVLDMTRRQDNLKSSEGTQLGYDTGQSSPELEDDIRREVLRNRSMRYMSSCDVNGRLLSPEHANLSDTEMSLDQVRSEGLRQWNMDMDVEYQYETFNGLPVYYGEDMYDSEDMEEYDPVETARAAYVEDYNFDVPEGMELMTYNRRLPDDGDARGVNAVDMVPMCRTVSGVARYEPDESSDMSRTDTAELEESDIENCNLWMDLWEDKDCYVLFTHCGVL